MPTVAVVAWSGADCHTATATATESSLEDCVPFADRGPLVFTLGFFITACLFLPFGRYQLKVCMSHVHFMFVFCLLFYSPATLLLPTLTDGGSHVGGGLHPNAEFLLFLDDHGRLPLRVA
jgi:hypothetical protein